MAQGARVASSQKLCKHDRRFFLTSVKPSTGNISVLREQYLREDLSCHSPWCRVCPDTSGECSSSLLKWFDSLTLGQDLRGHHQKRLTPPACITSCPFNNNQHTLYAAHYVIPSVEIVSRYLEILEDSELCGMVFLQTVVAGVRGSGGSKAHSRVKTLLKSERKGSVYFANELCRHTFCAQRTAESRKEWNRRLIWAACCWYATHLAPFHIVLLVDDHNSDWQSIPVLEEVATVPSNLAVCCMSQYLKEHYASSVPHYESLRRSLWLKAVEDTKGCVPHLTAAELADGIAKGVYLVGTLRVSRQRAATVAYVTLRRGSPVSFSGDICIEGPHNRNRAIHGDVVAVQLLPSEGADTEVADSRSAAVLGRVVGILERPMHEHVAVFPESGGETARSRAEKVLVIPFDVRVPKVRISTHLAEELCSHRIVIRIDGWEVDSQYPHGHFVCSLGPIGDVETETKAILVEHGLLSKPFTRAQLAELPQGEWSVSKEELSRRRDLRDSHLIFSIDPEGCEDIDDALSVRQKKNGQIELGVHIADVSHFVKADSLIDREAASRGTTVYLADRRYDMLPSLLSTDLCSLWSGRERCAVSALWEMDQNCNVKKAWYGRSVIRSAYKLTYEMAQSIADGSPLMDAAKGIPELSSLAENEVRTKMSNLKEAICSLMDVARVLKKRRFEDGALELEGVEVKLILQRVGDNITVEEILPKQPLEIHETVAECMIFANHCVAKRVYEAFPSAALLRRHPAPEADRFSQLLKCAAAKQFSINVSSNKDLALSLELCVDERDPEVNQVLRMLATYAMQNALYFSTGSCKEIEFHHYGLALGYYTHFTSPIRRYADLVVHRMLLAAVAQGGDTDSCLLPGPEALDRLCTHINKKNLASKFAQSASSELFQALHFLGREQGSPCVVEGIAVEIRETGLTVLVPKYGIRGTLHLQDKEERVACPGEDGAGVTFDKGSLSVQDGSITVRWVGGAYTLRLMDRLLVEVKVDMTRAHGPSFLFELVTCAAVEPDQTARLQAVASSSYSRMEQPGKGVVVKEGRRGWQGRRSGAVEEEWRQSEDATSLYSLCARLKATSLQDSSSCESIHGMR